MDKTELQQFNSQVLEEIPVELHFNDLAKTLAKNAKSSKFLQSAEVVFEQAGKLWRPRGVFRWLPVTEVHKAYVNLKLPEKDAQLNLTLGYSSRFMEAAHLAMIAVYTVGDDLELAVREASSDRRHLEAYLLNIIGLAVLEQTGAYVQQKVNTKAAELGWKVGPFLSPGSVHGWELNDQTVLCCQLPLEKIGVLASGDGVLHPFNTVSCLIGIGPGYTSSTVGSTCQVCSNNHRCEMKKQ